MVEIISAMVTNYWNFHIYGNANLSISSLFTSKTILVGLFGLEIIRIVMQHC